MKSFKKIVCLALIFSMLWSSLPLSVLAEDQPTATEQQVTVEEPQPETEKQPVLQQEPKQVNHESEEKISNDNELPLDQNENEQSKIVDSGSCGEQGDNVQWKLDEEGLLTIYGTGKMADYTDIYDSKEKISLTSAPWRKYWSSLNSVYVKSGVTNIGICAFGGCNYLTNVKIPESVVNIGNYSFYNCKNLGNVIIPEGVVSIGWDAFMGCHNLTEIILPQSLISIGAGAFEDCRSIENISLPQKITNIERQLFYGCVSLKNIYIPESLETIGDMAFSECIDLNCINIPENVENIGDQAFKGIGAVNVENNNKHYKSINGVLYDTYGNTLIHCPNSIQRNFDISESVTNISDYAFYKCSNLTEITIPENVISIGNGAFEYCTSLEEIQLPIGLESISKWVFGYCYCLNSIIIPENVKGIGADAFYNCINLVCIVVPESVESFGIGTFEGCINLKDLYYVGNETKWLNISGTKPNGTIHYNSILPNFITIKSVEESIKKGDSITMNQPQIFPENTTVDYINWSSSDNNIAVVNEKGIVTGKKAGIATIIARTINRNTVVAGTIEVFENPVTSIQLDIKSVSIKIGTSLELSSATTPENTTDQIQWTSSDTNIVTVDQNGNIHGIALGSAVITVTAESGISASCVVKVNPIEATSLTLNMSSLSCDIGDSYYLFAEIAPSNATDKTIKWSSSDESVVTIEHNIITAINEGIATITATISNGLTATCVVTVNRIEASSVSLNSYSQSIAVGGTSQLTATVYPSNTTDKTVIWSSSDESVATVDQSGTITALKAGTTNITAATTNGKSASCAVTIYAIQAEYVLLPYDEIELESGKTATLIATVKPDNTTDKALLWHSNDPTVAAVSDGKITAKAKGTVTITVETINGKTDSCIINVINEQWDEGVITKPATCCEKGIRTYTCLACGEKRTEEIAIDPNNHTFDQEVAKAEYLKTPATCTSKAVYYKSCKCGEKGKETFESGDSLGHQWGVWTKLDEKQHQRVCEHELSHKETANHVWDEGKVIKTPTTTEDGIKEYTCTVCQATKQEAIEKVKFIYGDPTGDGDINVSDALAVLKHIVKLDVLTGNNFAAADTNGDGDVNVSDALNILKFVVRLIDQLPVA